MADVTERWLPVPGWEEFYEVSDLGRVRSFDRKVPHWRGGTRLARGRILKAALDSRGYLQLNLCADGAVLGFGVHRLVLLAFAGPRPPGQEIRHLNGNKLDNRRANLRYGTRSENLFDRVRHGTDPNTNKTHCVNGHEFTEANTYIRRNPDGSFRQRMCHACRQLQNAEAGKDPAIRERRRLATARYRSRRSARFQVTN